MKSYPPQTSLSVSQFLILIEEIILNIKNDKAEKEEASKERELINVDCELIQELRFKGMRSDADALLQAWQNSIRQNFKEGRKINSNLASKICTLNKKKTIKGVEIYEKKQ